MTGKDDKGRRRIEVICGCMFSGKTGMLLERMRSAVAEGRTIAVFKHASDNRYGLGDLVSHGGERAPAERVAAACEILNRSARARLVVVDEAQFFGGDLVDAVLSLRESGRDVVLAGLDLDSWGLPFGPMPRLMEIADVLVVNKADKPAAVASENALRAMLAITEEILPDDELRWAVPLLKTVSLDGTGIPALAEVIRAHADFLRENGEWRDKEKTRLLGRMEKEIKKKLYANWLIKVRNCQAKKLL